MSSTEEKQNSNTGKQAAPPGSHRVVTFYSYKGGVGRSMALANIAVLLARDHGLRVIAVDWDLEAPGLHRYFNMTDDDLGEGVIDYLQNYKALVGTPKGTIKAEDLSIKRYLREVYEFSNGGRLQLLGAGLQQTKAAYVEKVRGFDWGNFYEEWNGAQVVEGLRNEFLELADVTLIDSRTGITDVGGVCTIQLPDTVVFVFVFNAQNLAGIEQVASELGDDNNPTLKALNRKPELFFLPCRKELSELRRLRDWEAQAANRFNRFCDTPKIQDPYGDTARYLRKTSVPYVPYFAYGEELAAMSKEGVELAESFEPLITLLLGEDSRKSAEKSQLYGTKAFRQFLVYSGLIAALSVAALVFFVFRPGAIGGVRVEILVLIKGALCGIIGSTSFVFYRSRLLASQDPWKINTRYILTSLFADTITGGVLGGVIAFWPFQYPYSLLGSLVAGFMSRSVVRRLIETVKAILDPNIPGQRS